MRVDRVDSSHASFATRVTNKVTANRVAVLNEVFII